MGPAQQLSVSPAQLAAGESVSVEGGGLPPGSQVTVQLTAPGGDVSREGVRVGEAGRFRLETPLRVVGSYQLVVRGQGLDETRVLEVRAALPKQPAPSPDPAAPDAEGAEAAPPEVKRVKGGLQATQSGALSWQLTFPARSGATTEPVFAGERLYVGHGKSVLRLEPRTGNILERSIVSGQVERLEALGGEAVAVTVRHTGELSERFTLRDGRVQEPVRFGAAAATFGFLRTEASVRDPAARLERDPTNPWLFLNLGLGQNDPGAAQTNFERAIATATTFYDLAGLATFLEARGHRALAADAFDAAMEDFAARGYDPRLLTSAGLEAAYHFPLTPLKAALKRRDDRSASFWAERLALAAPKVPGVDDALDDYAALLRAVDAPEAEVWERPPETTLIGPGLPEHVAATLGRSGWGFAVALLVTFGALQLTLFAKYARARRADRSEGGRAPWLFAVRYTTLSEKLVSLLLLAAVLACSALAGWQDATDPPPPALASGTLLSRPAQVFLEDAELSGPAGRVRSELQRPGYR